MHRHIEQVVQMVDKKGVKPFSTLFHLLNWSIVFDVHSYKE
jgi:hypothetical protein